MKIVFGILILCIVVIAHEFGHMIVAKASGIEVKEFCIGFGPKIVGFTKGGTLYSLRCIPFGGACIFDDMDANDENAIEESQFRKAPVWSRFLTIFAGPFFNFLLAFVFALFLMSNIYYPSTEVVEVAEGGAAAEAGMVAGDKIISINHSRVYLYPEVSMAVQLGVGRPLALVYEHEGVKHSVELIPKYDKEYGSYMIGVTFGSTDEVDEGHSPGEVIRNSYCYVRYMIKMTFASLRMLFTGQAGIDDMSGPVGVVEIVGEEYESAKTVGPLMVLLSMLNIAVLISANLGVVNLLPLPALDGGRLVFILIEAIRGKPVDAKTEGVVHFVGIALLLILMVVVMYNDIARLF